MLMGVAGAKQIWRDIERASVFIELFGSRSGWPGFDVSHRHLFTTGI
jgi:hypothetical protein